MQLGMIGRVFDCYVVVATAVGNAAGALRAIRLISRSAPVSRLHPFPKRPQTDCAPALRHSAIIFSSRTNGGCNQHGMGEAILG